MFFFTYFCYFTNKNLKVYKGKKLLINGAIFWSKTIGFSPTLFNTINPIDTKTQTIIKKINLLIIPSLLFSFFIKSFNVINKINENIQTVNISLNKLN